MSSRERGHREIDHTADRELELWAPDMENLLEEAAFGMYEMSGVETRSPESLSRQFDLTPADRASTLVHFLSELLYLLETDRVAFHEFQLTRRDGGLEAGLVGGPVVSVDKEIKAVTWHDLYVDETESGLEARVIFDV